MSYLGMLFIFQILSIRGFDTLFEDRDFPIICLLSLWLLWQAFAEGFDHAQVREEMHYGDQVGNNKIIQFQGIFCKSCRGYQFKGSGFKGRYPPHHLYQGQSQPIDLFKQHFMLLTVVNLVVIITLGRSAVIPQRVRNLFILDEESTLGQLDLLFWFSSSELLQL